MPMAQCPECFYLQRWRSYRGSSLKQLSCERCEHVGLLRVTLDGMRKILKEANVRNAKEFNTRLRQVQLLEEKP